MINPPEPKACARPWTKSEIRAARKTALAPLLQTQGMSLQPLPGGNFRVVAHEDLLVKDWYWRWPSRAIDGNAIDYFMRVEGKTFNQAMRILSASSDPSASPFAGPQYRSTLPSYASGHRP